MSERTVDYLLIGGGLASGYCARHLRELGADGSILMVGREADLPYDRPPLSKEYVRGESGRDEILVNQPSWYEEHKVETLTGVEVTALDAANRVVTLSNGDTVTFGKALLATGSTPRHLSVQGADLGGIHYLRTRPDSDLLREEAAKAERIALVGGSFIGTELAASFTKLGKECELIMLEALPLDRFFGDEVGRFLGGVLHDHGVKIHGAEELERFEGTNGRVSRVVTKSGLEIDCDFVVVGAGVTPNVELAKSAGITTNAGVLTNACLETSIPGIFAAGDIAEYESPIHGRRMRIEHWDVASNQGRTVAANMLGKNQPHTVVPYFWSDLADWVSIEYVGPALEWDEIWWRGRPEDGKFTAWYIKDHRLAGALAVDRSEDIETAKRLLVERFDLSGRKGEFENGGADSSPSEPAPRSSSSPAGVAEQDHGGLKAALNYIEAPVRLIRGRLKKRGTDLPGPGQGDVVEVNGKKVAVYRDHDGTVRAVSAVCTHLGCIVEWNESEQTWDCPCHGSRYDVTGRVLHGPATKPLPPHELES